MKRILFLLSTLMILDQSKSQGLSKKVQEQFLFTLFGFVSDQHNDNLSKYRSTELVFVVFEGDSTGKVSSIDVKGDADGYAYHLLQKMPLSLFKGIQSNEIANRIFVLPYFHYIMTDDSIRYKFRPDEPAYRSTEFLDLGKSVARMTMLEASVIGHQTTSGCGRPVKGIPVPDSLLKKQVPVIPGNRNNILDKR